jgi:hypothetical protein
MRARILSFSVIAMMLATACAAPAASPSPTAKPLATITITAPKAGATVATGDVVVTYDVSDVTLVPAASAQKAEDYHLHAAMDVDTSTWIGTGIPVPVGVQNPSASRLMHTAAKTVTFTNVAAGDHTVTVWLSLASHVSVRPPVSAVVKFTVR